MEESIIHNKVEAQCSMFTYIIVFVGEGFDVFGDHVPYKGFFMYIMMF